MLYVMKFDKFRVRESRRNVLLATPRDELENQTFQPEYQVQFMIFDLKINIVRSFREVNSSCQTNLSFVDVSIGAQK